MSLDAAVRDLELPRENGELVFETPWSSRAFGMAVALHEQGVYDWDRFREKLVEQIGAHDPDDGGRYYERWLAAFERLLLDRGIVSEQEVATRAAEIAEEDDHGHEHDHDHHH